MNDYIGRNQMLSLNPLMLVGSRKYIHNFFLFITIEVIKGSKNDTFKILQLILIIWRSFQNPNSIMFKLQNYILHVKCCCSQWYLFVV